MQIPYEQPLVHVQRTHTLSAKQSCRRNDSRSNLFRLQNLSDPLSGVTLDYERPPHTKKGGAVVAPPFEMYRNIRALEKRLKACLAAPEDQRVNVMRALIGVDRF